ncbi:MAG: ATP synthase F0 subunit C [Pseudobdellovibrionaceae bacterium]
MNKLYFALLTFLVTTPAFAQEAVAAAAGKSIGDGLIGLAAAIAIGMAAIGGTTAQGNVGANFLEGVARNPAARPAMFVPMILALALIESLVVLGFLIALFLFGKI